MICVIYGVCIIFVRILYLTLMFKSKTISVDKLYSNSFCFTTTKCLETVVGGRQGHAPCKILLLPQMLFLAQSSLMNITRLTKLR